jgi:hypothetical protein
MTFKPTNQEIDIDDGSNVYAQTSIRVINTGTTNLLNLSYANNLVYGSFLLYQGETIFIEKAKSDIAQGAYMKAVPIVNYKW